MGRKVKIVDKGVSFDKEKYKGIFGDFDKDGVVNIDDANPTDKTKKGKVEKVSASESFTSLLELKKQLDKVMEDSVEILKKKTPKDADIYARTKTPYSIIKKLVDKRLLHPEKGLQDLVGTTIAVDSYDDLIEVRNNIRKGVIGEVIEEDNFYSNPNNGYMAYHYIIKVGKIPVEVQLKTKRMKEVNEITHEFYKKGTIHSENALALAKLSAKADKGDKKAITKFNQQMKNKSTLKKSLTTSKKAKGGVVIEEYDDLPSHVQEVVNRDYDDDEDPYKEAEKMRGRLKEIGWAMDYDLSGAPTEFWEVTESKAKGGAVSSKKNGGWGIDLEWW